MQDHFGLAIVEMGLRPKEFWKLEIIDFMVLFRQLARKKAEFEQITLIAARIAGWIPASMLGDGKKKIKPHDFITFPFEKNSRPSRSQPYSRDEKLHFLKTMKPEWIELIDN